MSNKTIIDIAELFLYNYDENYKIIENLKNLNFKKINQYEILKLNEKSINIDGKLCRNKGDIHFIYILITFLERAKYKNDVRYKDQLRELKKDKRDIYMPIIKIYDIGKLEFIRMLKTD